MTLLLVISVEAQQKKEVKRKDGEIENTEVIIEKNKKITLPEADRNFEKISAILPKPQPEIQQYNLAEPKLLFPDLRINFVLPAPVVEEPQPQLGNYARIGAGNYGATLGELFLGNTRHPHTQISLYAKHLGYLSGPKDKENSASGDQQVKISGNYFREQLSVHSSLAYHRQQAYFYGYQVENKPLRDTIKQVFNSIDFQAGLKNRLLDSLIGFKIDLNLSYLSDRMAAREFETGLQISGDYLLNTNLSLLLNTDIFLTQRQDENLSQNRNLFRLKPQLKFIKDNFRVAAGFNFVGQNDSLLAKAKLYPIIEAQYQILNNVEIFAGFSGDVQRNTLRSFIKENLLIAPNVVVRNTEKVSEITGGIKAGLGKSFSTKVDFSVGTFRSLAFFKNKTSDTAKFSMVYEDDTQKSKIFQASIALAYQTKQWVLNLRTDFFNYQLATFEEAIHRPKFKANLNAKYYFGEKLAFSADCYYISGIFAILPASDNFLLLPNVIDLNLKADYSFNKKIGASISLNNILAQSYQKYLYYPQRGFQILVSFGYSF
ncbi:MAG: hypothetical protein H7Y04_16015 [Verrucomicrobia bacterium]|nr:hypothetical protein [Cytophagales bacterium]